MNQQKAEIDSFNSYVRDIEDMNTRQKARISYLERELNNVRNFGRSTTPERLEPLRSHENPAVRFESVHKAENLEKKLREAEFFHQQEIQEYQNHIKSLEYSIQNKDSELQMMYNQANKMQQELETTNSRIRTYEMGVMDKQEPYYDEISAARAKIEMLQSELSFATKAYNTELKELKSQNVKNENEVRRVGEALDNYKKKNRELVDKIVQLEKELDFSKQKPRSRTPLPLEKIDKGGLQREDSHGAASPWAKSRPSEKDLDTSMDNDRSRPRLGRGGTGSRTETNNNEDELKRRLEFKALQQERDIFKAQKEALEKRLEKLLQMSNTDENMQIETQGYIAETEKKTIWNLRKELQEVKSQNESYKKTVEDLEEELRNIEDNDLKAEGKRESAAALRQKVIELRNLIGELEGQNKTLKTSKLEAERKVVALQSELENQNGKFSQEINNLMDYNTKLQTEMGGEKKKFVEYLQQMNKMHVERQEDQLGRKTNLEEEASKFRRVVYEKDNEIKILNTKHENEIKKLQSEIEVAKDFGDSHLREIENLKWEVEKLNDEIKRIKELKKKAEDSLALKDKQLHEAFSDLNRVQKVLRRAKDEGLPVQDIDAALSRAGPQRGMGKTPDTTDLGDTNYLISKPDFIKAWESNNQKANTKPMLLAKALKQKDLVQSLLQEKDRLLDYIEEALADENPEMYEKGIQLMGSLIDDELLEQEDRLYPFSANAAVKTLCPGRKDETEDLTASRHYGALVALGFLVDTGSIWDLNLLRLAEKFSTLNILIRYLKNAGGKKLWQKRRALRILKSILDTMQQEDVPEILASEAFDLFLENIEDTDPFINRNAAEAVSILSHVPNAQKRMENEQNLSFVCRKLLKGDGKDIEIYLLDSLLNLSNSRAVQEILRNHKMLDFFVSTGLDDKYPANVQVALRLLINMAPVIDDKGVLYERTFTLISRDLATSDRSTKKLALALLAVVIKKNSKYDKDLILFPHVVQSLDYEDLEIQLLAIQIVFVLCARFQHPMMNCFVEERGIERCVSLYCTTPDPNIFNITGNLMLLLASAHTKYIENLLAQGGYPMVRRLFKDLEHPENQAVYRAANILRLLSTQPIFLQSLGEPNEKVASLKAFLLRLLQGVKPDEELISFGLGILRVIIVPEAIPLLRKHQIMDLLLGFLIKKVFNVQIMIDVMNCLQSFLIAGAREGVVLDMIAEHYGKGIEVLSSLIAPPLRRNALAQSSIGLWEALERCIQSKMIDAKYSQNLTSILKKILDESDIPELKKSLTGIMQKIK